MKKLIFLTIFMLLTGCDYIELNDLSIIKSIAVDYQTNEYFLYAEIINEINDENKPSTEVITVNEESIKKCFNKLILLSNKTIHYSHIDLLILSTNLKDSHLQELFNYFLNTQNFRNDFMTVASSNVSNLIEKSEYDEVEQLIENNQYQDLINIDIEEVIKNYLNNKSFTLSLIEYEEGVIYKGNVKYENDQVSILDNN